MSVNGIGRPSSVDWNEQLISEIEDGILSGVSLTAVLHSLHVPVKSFYRRRMNDSIFDNRIARAQEAAQELEVDRMQEIADNSTPETVDVDRLRIWARQWIAGKRKPKKYGAKIEHEHNSTMKVVVIGSVKDRVIDGHQEQLQLPAETDE